MMMQNQIQNWLNLWATPYKRYQHQRAIHAIRLGLAVVCATAIGQIFTLPHSEWIPITVFVVLGTLQYQGAIVAKAWERMLGTVIGMVVGLTLLWLNQRYLEHNIVFFLLVALVSAACGWKSLGTHGYIAMLAGLTMCMLLGHGGNHWLEDGLLRALNVVIGAVIALSASRLIPIKSILMWRFTTADNLNACARQLAAFTNNKAVPPEQWFELRAEQRVINARLVKARSMLNSATREIKINPHVMESLQQGQRSIVSSVNLLLANVPNLPKPRLYPQEEQLLNRHFFSLQFDLRRTARLLKGDWRQHISISFDEEEAVRALAAKLPFEWQGFIWVSLNIRSELFTLLTLLQSHRHYWLMKSEQQRLGEYGE